MVGLLSNIRTEQFLANTLAYHLNVKKECLLLEQINARILGSNICVLHSNRTPTLKYFLKTVFGKHSSLLWQKILNKESNFVANSI
jgi:hypothetical protein